MVSVHSGLECEGRIRVNRFTSDHTYSRNKNIKIGKYDGLHPYSLEGTEALTSSVQAILVRAGLVKAVRREGRERRSNYTPTHTHPQTPTPTQNPQYINPWLEAPASRGFLGNQRGEESGRQYQEQFFQLPTQNRFSNL